ncbi:MAG TPA: glycosyltransferase [Gemmataceae bacterium]|jgi:glycosyltransferase involved in cell wall biosynthesis
MISFIIPAYNEEQLLGRTLITLNAAARMLDEPFEVVVVDDASTDRTAAIAREQGARVVSVNHRQIAATRNAGAREAQGDILFFVDADTQANARAIRAGLRAIQQGAVGGGCVCRYDGWIPLWARILLLMGDAGGRLLKLVGGAFLFCRRSDFEAIGGFCERYYAAEEVVFVKALKRRGLFVIPWETVVTSNRKLCTMSLRRVLGPLFRLAVGGPESFHSREGLDLWYGPEARD